MLLLLAGGCAQPAYANSAQRHWSGTDVTGAVVTGEDCPIVVERELPGAGLSGYGQLPCLYRESHGGIHLP